MMKNLVQKTNNLIKERNLSYSPELFNQLFEELKNNTQNLEEENIRVSKLNTNKDRKKLDFIKMSAYGMNKRPY
jgi:hypothetical protein